MIPASTTILFHATAPSSGAIAILQLVGDGCDSVLAAITGVSAWPVGRMRLVDLAGVDRGLAVMLTARVAQIMPHGGTRVVQRLTAALLAQGVSLATPAPIDARAIYPEARDRIEALMLITLARAESSLAIDALLDQPRRWREWIARGRRAFGEDDLARSRRLNRLIEPPVVALAGRPNVGKSTLSNALLGRTMSIAADVPGTTRDYTAGRIDLAGLTVDWHDTPGIRVSDDVIEQQAIAIAGRLLDRADLLIAMRDGENDWPELPREADVWVVNKCDAAGDGRSGDGSRDRPLAISALTGHGLADLARLTRERLVPSADIEHSGVWLFDGHLMDL